MYARFVQEQGPASGTPAPELLRRSKAFGGAVWQRRAALAGLLGAPLAAMTAAGILAAGAIAGGPEWLSGIATAAFASVIPLVVLAGFCLDGLERRLDALRTPADENFRFGEVDTSPAAIRNRRVKEVGK
jgi:hypothetical protein